MMARAAWSSSLLLLVLVAACGGSSTSSSDATAQTVDTGSPDGRAAPTGGPGTLTASDQDVLILLQGGNGSLDELAGVPAHANAMNVQEVVNVKGFWIGADEFSRIFVEVVGSGAPKVAADDEVTFDGTMEQNDGAETYGISEAQGAQQFRTQGLHVRVQAGDLKTP